MNLLRHSWYTVHEYLIGDAQAALAALEARRSGQAWALLVASLKVNWDGSEASRLMLRAANCLVLGDPLLAMQVLREVEP